jgi:probable F420-dependent oxidoreductase
MAEAKVAVQLHPVHASIEDLRQAWLRAEEIGVAGVWVWDHFLPTYGPAGGTSFECWSLLAAIAATTSRVQIGSLVSPIGYRNPALLAHVAQTVDALSGGRLVLGLGAGWYRRDYVRHGYEFPPVGRRLDQLEEGIAVVKERFRREGIEIPLLIGGGGERRTLPLVAAEAQMWNGFGEPEWFAERSRVLDECCRRIGRDPGEVRRSALTDARRGSRDWRAYLEAGADQIVIGLGAPFDWELVEDALNVVAATAV